MRIVMVLVFLISALAQAEVYKWVDEKGKIHFSDTKPGNADAIEQSVEIKNQNIKVMDDKAKKLLEGYDERKLAAEQVEKLTEKEKTLSKSKNKSPFGDYEYRCFTPSPSMRGDLLISDEILPRILEPFEKEKIRKLFRQMRGRWKGKITGYNCQGDEESPVKEEDNFKVTLSSEIGISEGFSFDANLKSDSGTSRHERYDFYIKDNVLRMNAENKSGDIEINEIASDTLAFTRKFRSGRRFGRSGPLQEVVFNISVVRNELYINRISYSSGKLGSISTWKLSKVF